jgi:signal transduction histidine kinase
VRRRIVAPVIASNGTGATRPARSLRAMAAELTLPRVLVALGIAVLVAAGLNAWFVTPFVVLLGRMLVIAMVLLLAFVAAGRLHPAWVPGWLAQVVTVIVAAPLATFLVYLPAVQGDVFAVLQHEGRAAGFVLITGTVLVVAPVLALGALYRERDAQARNQALQFALEKSTLEKQALDAELKLLHAQIKPHFLFNTLGNVQALVESGSPRAATVLQHLITYLGSAMPRLADSAATLGNEVALVRAYLELMRMRMPDRLEFAIDVPPALGGLRFPSMALLTLVENAVQHGIDPCETGGRIDVSAAPRADGGVEIAVVDSGVGLDAKAAPGTGLANLRSRLAAFYGAGARLELAANAPRGVVARIVVPHPA